MTEKFTIFFLLLQEMFLEKLGNILLTIAGYQSAEMYTIIVQNVFCSPIDEHLYWCTERGIKLDPSPFTTEFDWVILIYHNIINICKPGSFV